MATDPRLRMTCLRITTNRITRGSTDSRTPALTAGTLMEYWPSSLQLYLSDPAAQVVRPERWLAGFARVPLEPGEERRVTFRLHADRTAFTGRAGTRIVEPGEIGVAVGGASDGSRCADRSRWPGLSAPSARTGYWTPLVRHAHRRQDLGQRDRRDLVGPLVAVPQDLAHVARVPRVLCPPRPDRGEQVVDRGGEQLLQRGRPAPADLGRDLVRIAVQTQ